VAGVGLAASALAGCASAAIRDPAAPHPDGNVQAASSKQLAVAETRHLLTLFPMPPAARRIRSGPGALNGPAMGTSVSSSLIDTAQFWRVPMPMAQASEWITAHPQRGLPANGQANSDGPNGVTSVGYAWYDDRTSNAWTEAQLEVGVAPAGASASVWRIDGIALWLTAKPAPAPGGGSRLTVTVADGCPASDRGAGDVPPGSDSSLLPAGRPTGGLICAYTGLNGDPFALRAQVRLGSADAARLARTASAIGLAHTDGGVVNCPADFGTATVIAFSYPHASAALWLADSGCQYVSNGAISVGFGGGMTGLARFAAAVAALVRTR
jgi:hypothetical protein